jgi:hypothetical protein
MEARLMSGVVRSTRASALTDGRTNSSEWLDEELGDDCFADVRHHRRLRSIVAAMSQDVGGTIPHACQDAASTKAAYRFFASEEFDEEEILAGHFGATGERARACDGRILIIHDTTEFSFERQDEAEIGWTKELKRGSGGYGPRFSKVCGILMHGSLAVSQEGLPLGLAAVKFWNRPNFKGAKARSKINDARIPIAEKESYRWLEGMRASSEAIGEPKRCVHIGDRESDIIEFFATADELGTHFLIRTSADRVASKTGERVGSIMRKTLPAGTHAVEVRNAKGDARKAMLEIKFKTLSIYPPDPKAKTCQPLELTVIHASETNPPKGLAAIEWKLMTNLKVVSLKSAITKLEWYAMRWKIETYHKILKSGCKIEDSRLGTKERLTKLIAVSCIVGWRLFWMTMINRTDPDAAPAIALTKLEIAVLDKRVPDKANTPKAGIARYIQKLARLGGYLARNNDPPPGIIVIWRGYIRLADMVDTVTLFNKIRG